MQRAWARGSVLLRPRLRTRRPAAVLAALGVLAASALAGCSSPAPAVPAARAPSRVSAPAAVPTTAPTTQPALVVFCPARFGAPLGAGLMEVEFGYLTFVPAPFRVRIDYGDGRVYENDAAHLALVFSHTYTGPGTRTMSATLTDAAGTSTRATCVVDWVPAAAAGAGTAGPAAS